jgi:hypothetical protein
LKKDLKVSRIFLEAIGFGTLGKILLGKKNIWGFAVRLRKKTHDKVFFKKEMMLHLFGVWDRASWRKRTENKDFCRAFSFGRTTKSLFVVCFFFIARPVKKRMAKNLFDARPK